jgi:hypothetical protein
VRVALDGARAHVFSGEGEGERVGPPDGEPPT